MSILHWFRRCAPVDTHGTMTEAEQADAALLALIDGHHGVRPFALAALGILQDQGMIDVCVTLTEKGAQRVRELS